MNEKTKAQIVYNPKLAVYTLVRGGDYGEKTLGVYWDYESAFEAFWEDCKNIWGEEFRDALREAGMFDEAKDPKYYFLNIFHDYMSIPENAPDGYMSYLFNASDVFNDDLCGKLSPFWWWITKHELSIPSNISVNK